MLNGIVAFSLRFRWLVVLLGGMLVAYGIYRGSQAGLDIFPEFSPKAVIIQTEAPGLATEQVELLVTQPIEQALSGLLGLDYARSESIQGLSIVTAVFADDTDLMRNRQFVAERLASVRGTLPLASVVPVIVPLASSSATVRTIGVQSDTVDPMLLRELVDSSIVPNLLSVRGVADVNVFGGEGRSLQVQLRPEALRLHGMAVDDLARALSGVTDDALALGFVENANQRLYVQAQGQSRTPAALQDLVIRQNGPERLTLGEVADVRIAPQPPIGAAQIMGKPAIVMMIISQYGANTLTVSNLLRDRLAQFERELAPKGITLYPDLFVPANYIEASLSNISEHLLIGAGFVVAILLLFLFDVRAALISVLAIPLSLLVAALILIEAGINLNIMVLGGLAIALDEVVDDAIIDTENIYRRLRDHRRAGDPGSTLDVVLAASLEVRGSVVYASFIVALVFVPLLTIGGVAGRLFAPLGIAYILAILASLGVALTLTPALCALLLGRGRLPAREPPLIRAILPAYTRVLRAICRRPWLALTGTLAALAFVVATLPGFGSGFLPPLREGHYIVHTSGMPGSSLQESIRLGTRLTTALLELPGVRSVSQWAGRAERGADTYGTHYSEYEVALAPMNGPHQQTMLERIRALLGAHPGWLFEANTFLTERIDETISGYTAPVVVNLFGRDLAALDDKAQQLAQLMRGIPGAADVQLRAVANLPVAQVRLLPERLRALGVSPQAVLEALAVGSRGQVVGNLIDGNRWLDIVLVAGDEARDEITDLGDLPLRARNGALVALREVVALEQVAGRYNILRRAGQRLQSVTCHVVGRELSEFNAELAGRLQADFDVPSDMHVEITGAAVEQARSRRALLVDSLLAGVAVLALIAVAVGSGRHVVIVLANLPFALAGGVVAVLVAGATLSAGSVVGFVTLFGITVRNSIMLISHYRHLVLEAGLPWTLDTVVRGARERLPSIAMTALVTALAMLPIANDSDNPGREIMGPMASIIIGGLASSALLNLLVMPALMWRFGRFPAPDGATYR